MNGKLLDTTVLIDLSRGKNTAADFTLLHLSPTDSAKGFELMLTYSKSHNLAVPDALIAATAIIQNLELATDNDRHFKMISDLKVNRPY
jgi:hypothetical protein